jgi:hypothetical protein
MLLNELHNHNITTSEIQRVCKDVFELNTECVLKHHDMIKGVRNPRQTNENSINDRSMHIVRTSAHHNHNLPRSQPLHRNSNTSASKQKEWYNVKEQDTLFWHLYILKYGMQQFIYHKNKTEIKNKTTFQWVEEMQTQKANLKPVFRHYKLNYDDVMNDLASNKRIEMTTFLGVCITLQMPVIILHHKVAYVIEHTDATNIADTPNDKIYSCFDFAKKQMKYDKVAQTILTDRYIVGKYWGKPFLSKSSYKLTDIQKFCAIVGVETVDGKGKAKKKDILWEELNDVLILDK